MTDVVDLEYPFVGRWLVQNSPANRVPSHGTTLFASSRAIDFVPVGANGRTAPFTLRSAILAEPPGTFPGFGRELHAPCDGVVVAADDRHADHPAYRGLPSIGYALTQRRRVRRGWGALAGNHVLVARDGVVVALCHLAYGSLRVQVGQRVRVGDVIATCGNSGNSTEPHVHVQAVDQIDLARAVAVPISFDGALPRNGQVVNAGPSRAGPREPARGL